MGVAVYSVSKRSESHNSDYFEDLEILYSNNLGLEVYAAEKNQICKGNFEENTKGSNNGRKKIVLIFLRVKNFRVRKFGCSSCFSFRTVRKSKF